VSSLQQFSGLEAVHLPAKPLHLAIGMFDGVHLGHRAVIETAVQSAREVGGVSAVLTFWPHPSVLFRPDEPTRLFMPPAAKVRVMSRLGVDALIVQNFSKDYACIAAEDFLPHLQRYLPHLAAVYVGENWRFGRGRKGDVRLLVREARRLGLGVFSAPRVNFDGEAISSTRIRELLEVGEIEKANALLGYAYFAEGRVAPGKGLGRQIGFPTLNIEWAPELTPRYGVYAVRLSRADGSDARPGVANYGVRPTVEQTQVPRLEVHVLSECPFATGDEVSVELRRFLRPEQKFSDLAALRSQIAQDRATAAEWWAKRWL
jgi:riboflavin kinase/FMN adenylyltransferase